jgi:uncharacterized protein YjbI with pentapeptide repeats
MSTEHLQNIAAGSFAERHGKTKLVLRELRRRSATQSTKARKAAKKHAKECRRALNTAANRPFYRGPSLAGVDLRGTNFDGSDLPDADLRGTNFDGSDLTGACLRFSNLEGASFEDCAVDGIDVKGARFRGGVLNWNKDSFWHITYSV